MGNDCYELLSIRGARFILFLKQAQDEQPITIVTLNPDVLDRARKLNHLFEPAVSNFKLIMRNAFTTGTVAPRSAQAQNVAIHGDFHVAGFNARQIDFHNPAVCGAVDIRGGTPQAARRPALPVVANHAEIAFKRFAGHSDNSVSRTLEGEKGIRLKSIIEVSLRNRDRREASTDYADYTEASTDYADYTDRLEANQRNLRQIFGLSSS